jgi:hypothetical protein
VRNRRTRIGLLAAAAASGSLALAGITMTSAAAHPVPPPRSPQIHAVGCLDALADENGITNIYLINATEFFCTFEGVRATADDEGGLSFELVIFPTARGPH